MRGEETRKCVLGVSNVQLHGVEEGFSRESWLIAPRRSLLAPLGRNKSFETAFTKGGPEQLPVQERIKDQIR